MPAIYCLYLDDTGTRNPNHKPGNRQYRDWFALGGVLLKEEDEDIARRLHQQFCARWNIDYPLHSSDIRLKVGRFSWLARLSAEDLGKFMEDLSALVVEVPGHGHACVVDRIGYDKRYREKYGRGTWNLCRTAFSVVCERAAKIARSEGRKLRVYPERGDKTADKFLKSYYEELRTKGMPFSDQTSSKYRPMSASELKDTLYELAFKSKSSPMAQLADLYAYPLARGRYQSDYRPFSHLVQNNKIIDCILTQDTVGALGIKYSCFDEL